MTYPLSLLLNGADPYPVGMLTLPSGRVVYSTGRVLVGLRYPPSQQHVAMQSHAERFGSFAAQLVGTTTTKDNTQ